MNWNLGIKSIQNYFLFNISIALGSRPRMTSSRSGSFIFLPGPTLVTLTYTPGDRFKTGSCHSFTNVNRIGKEKNKTYRNDLIEKILLK